MIVVNAQNELQLQTQNRSLVARTIKYNRKTIYRWAKIFKKKKTYNDYVVYFDEELYNQENPKK
jgi:hypothetical protein